MNFFPSQVITNAIELRERNTLESFSVCGSVHKDDEAASKSSYYWNRTFGFIEHRIDTTAFKYSKHYSF